MIARVFALGILATAAAGLAHAQAYVRGGLTASDAEPYESTVGYEVAGGYRLGGWRTELSLDSNTFDISEGTLPRLEGTDGTVTSAFLSLYYDMDIQSFVTPYVGGGLGLSNIDAPPLSGFLAGHLGAIPVNVDGFNVTEVVWHAAVGVNLAFGPNLSLDASLRYAAYTDKTYFDGVPLEDLTADGARQVRVSLRYGF